MFIYPTSKFKSSSESDDAAIYTSVVVLVFVFAAVVLLHDWQMRRLHTKVIEKRHIPTPLFQSFPAGAISS
jgi:cytochrome oxidase assembly protein ShyY1